MTSWLAFVGGLQGSLIMSGDELRPGVLASAGVVAATLVADAALIPHFGAQGAAIAGAGTSVLTVIVFGALQHRTLGLRPPLPPWGALTAAGVAGSLAALTARQPLVVPCSIGIIGYLIVLVATKTIGRDDLDFARAVLRRQPPQR